MTRFRRAALFLLAAFIAASGAAFAATNNAGRFTAVKADAPPPLDPAKIGDPAWQKGLAATGLVSVTTHQPASSDAHFSVLYDATAIYVAARVDQHGAPIAATQRAHGLGFGTDDFVGIGIDPTGNGTPTYFFMTTPLGTRYQQSSESARYNPPWTAAASIDADGNGWSAVMAIPLSALRTTAGPQRWRFNFIRRVAAINDNQSWAYDPVMNDGGGGVNSFPAYADVRFWPALEHLQLAQSAPRPKPRGEVYLLGSAGRDRHAFAGADGSFGRTGDRPAGADVVVPITGTLAFVGAVAPDFSNVETDQQTIAPQEFRRALNEYRPFFSQGAGFFDPSSLTGINQPANKIFYSPAIGPFDRGLKVEGTVGHQSIGVLEAQGSGFDDLVFGYKHTLPSKVFSWSINGVETNHRDGNATIDPRAGRDETWQFQVAGRDDKTGFVYTLEQTLERGSFVTHPRLASKSEDFVDVHRPNYELFTGYRSIGPEYNPVLGYTSNADVRGPIGFLDLNGTLAKNGPFKRVELFVNGDRFLDRSGAVHQADLAANLDVQFKGPWHLFGGPATSELRTYDNGLVGYPTYTGGITSAYNQHSVGAGYRDGTPTPIDGTYAWGPFGGVYLQTYTLSTSRPIGTRFNLSAEYDGTRERPPFGAADGQNLRRLTFGESLGPDSNVSFSLRAINGRGGFALPGVNLAASFHRRFRNDSELFVNYGTPAASATLQRVVLKYVMRTGAGAGT